MENENLGLDPKGWYMREAGKRERALNEPLEDKPETMRLEYDAWLAAQGRDMDSVAEPEAVEEAPLAFNPLSMNLKFDGVPVYGKAWVDLQKKAKKYKMELIFQVNEQKFQNDFQHNKMLGNVHKDHVGMFRQDAKRGVFKSARGYAV